MKIYLAAMFSRRKEMETYAQRFKNAGHEITARWVFGGETDTTFNKDLTRERAAAIDLEDVDAADCVISFTHPRGTKTPGGGRHVEFGYALAKGKRLILIGERENVFHHVPSVEIFEDLDKCLIALLP